MNEEFEFISRHFDAVIWDFDGVIIDSDSIRVNGFRYALRNYKGRLVEKLIEFHRKNGGFSRYKKFEYFFENICKLPHWNRELALALDEFSKYVTARLISPELLIMSNVRGVEFLNDRGINQFLVSASDEKELQEIVSKLDIANLFQKVLGSPTPKIDNVAGLLEKYRFNKTRTLLIGDSINDLHAAEANKISFMGFAYKNHKPNEFPRGVKVLRCS